MSRLLFEARAAVLALEAKERVLDKEIELAKLKAAQRQWVGLTLEDKEEFLALDIGGSRLDAIDWAARKLKEKNT